MVGAAGAILRAAQRPDRAEYTALPVEIYNYAKNPYARSTRHSSSKVAAGGILILLAILADHERHGHRDPEPLPALCPPVEPRPRGSLSRYP